VKINKLLIAAVMGIISSITSLEAANPRVEVEVGDQPEYVDEGVVWGGPGFYFGVWIDNESQHRNWHRRHYQGRYYRGRSYSGGHHSGGGHHGGSGHGGRHR
jgi:hypothetical protein